MSAIQEGLQSTLVGTQHGVQDWDTEVRPDQWKMPRGVRFRQVLINFFVSVIESTPLARKIELLGEASEKNL